MKKIIAFVIAALLVLSMVLPASAATGGFDIGKAQPSINNAVTEIVNKPTFDWSAWLNNLLARFR